MQIDFRPSGKTAVDARSGITISYARVLPSLQPSREAVPIFSVAFAAEI